MDFKQELNEIARNVLYRSVLHADFFYNISNYNLSSVGDLYVMWQNRKNVKQLALEKLATDHEEKIEQFKNIILTKDSFTTTVFAMRKDERSPIVVTDGIHRIIGYQRAFLDSTVKNKVTINMLLFEGERVADIPDYTLSIPI